MLFHVIGIKEVVREVENKKHNIDLLIKWDSEEFVRTFLQRHNIIVLSILEYNKPSSGFWNLQIDILYKGKQQNLSVSVFSYLTDMKNALLLFMVIWFKVSYINFVDDNKIKDQEVKNIMQDVMTEFESIKTQKTKEAKQKKEQEKKIYKDEKLEKTIKIAEQTFTQIEDLLQKVGPRVSQSKLREIKLMEQELTKLKMWRNDDKMSELLEKIYDKIDVIETEYLDYMQKNISYPIENSIVTNIDIISENQKYKKSKKIKAIWAKRDADDNYYLSFESLGIYIKFLFKDLKGRTNKIQEFVGHLFWYLDIAILAMLVVMSFVFWFNKVSYALDENLYHYVFLLKIALFGLVLFLFQKIKKTTVYANIIFLIISVIITVVLFWLIKTNLAF